MDTDTIDDANVFPGAFRVETHRGGRAARAEAGIPGAYLKSVVRGSALVRLLIDGTANGSCPPPRCGGGCRGGPRRGQVDSLTKTGAIYALPVADGLDRERNTAGSSFAGHASGSRDRWRKSMVHLRLAGIELEGAACCDPRR